ncbi:hypothetical protein [Streptosporangium roseum]|uniref:Spore-associated protein A n=1 Tax=Streptosporangium roseum (strain ATCC 12428 / DSM 43021 / JCM 3005 / KCTC 9067 / NCIMB 10171 / NRRL 2505 / NI 9100) TaxID=479432 RepID=D2BC63_STRRD|nr:hypothetical protein [Streptosporangium roseum]ACZ88086.1 hypothetical protein Sros_5322 [Streptosporangium roseum DSM 43021]
MSLRTKIQAGLTCAVITAATVMTAANPAAATGGTCGSGYNFLKSYPLKSVFSSSIPGELSIYYNSSTGKNCAITRAKAAWDGKAQNIYVSLSDGGSPAALDPPAGSSKNYRYYAGPVYKYLKGKCVYAIGYLEYGGISYSAHAYEVHCG